MDFHHKYLKYKNKYNGLKKYRGGEGTKNIKIFDLGNNELVNVNYDGQNPDTITKTIICELINNGIYFESFIDFNSFIDGAPIITTRMELFTVIDNYIKNDNIDTHLILHIIKLKDSNNLRYLLFLACYDIPKLINSEKLEYVLYTIQIKDIQNDMDLAENLHRQIGDYISFKDRLYDEIKPAFDRFMKIVKEVGYDSVPLEYSTKYNVDTITKNIEIFSLDDNSLLLNKNYTGQQPNIIIQKIISHLINEGIYFDYFKSEYNESINAKELENDIMNYMVMMKGTTNLTLWVNNIKDPNDVNYLLFLARYAISTLLNNPTQLITLLNKINRNHIKQADRCYEYDKQNKQTATHATNTMIITF